ncbi:MAG: arylsulfatase [Nitrospirota bacterium]
MNRASLCILAVLATLAIPLSGVAEVQLDRTVLPIHEPTYPPITELDARKATPPPRFEVKAPADAPNVVIVMIDDIGFGHASTFGGGIPMPALERVAQNGLRYNMFHTTALCSPTRTALLTGRNHHTNNAGAIMEVATAFPGNTGVRPNSVAPLAEMLRLNGYSTAAFGKYHETAPWEVSVSGPYDRWPTHSGFDKFYGFLGGETNQWSPYIFDGTTKVDHPEDPDYHFTTDMTNQAIIWIRTQQALTPDKPFYAYFATGATHAPHHVPKDWIAKFKGKFDAGWDTYREETLARQIKLGLVPAGTKLAPKPKDIKDWDTLSADEKKLFSRQMEVFAAFAAHTDHEIGRLEKAIEDLGEKDNTLFLYIVGDNGSSAEGGMAGMFNELTYFNGVHETVADMLKNIDRWGGPETFPHMAAGWAVAGNTPFMWTKQVASNYGGTRNPVVIQWPKGIKAKGEIRSQWHHIVDIAPTVMEAAGLPFPKKVNGTIQKPFEGVSMVYTFDDPDAKSRHTTQYFEIIGNRAIYHEGWLAGTVHKAPWEAAPRVPLAQDKWELYDTTKDFSLTNDLAARNPEKLKEMQELFMKEAVKYNVLPIDDRSIERFDPKIAGRPDLMGDRTSLTLYEGMTGIMENAFINVKNRSLTITANIEVPQNGANGVILCQGGRFGGWSLYMKDGKASYVYNWLGLEQYTISVSQPVPAGKAVIKVDFDYDGGRGNGGKSTIYVNGQKAAEGRIGHTQANIFSLDDAADVGVDEGTPVTAAYAERHNEFTGKIENVTIDLKEMK